MPSQKIIILGSNNSDTSLAYKKFNLGPSILVTNAEQNYTVGHTGREDVNSDAELETILSSANIVYWADPDPIDYITTEIYFNFLDWIKEYQTKHKNIVNFDSITVDPYNWKYQLPVIDANDLIALGCSATAGTGVPNSDDRFANIVAKELGLNCVNLGQVAGSFQKIYDIFTQLEFVSGQTVVMQIPPLGRLRYCDADHKLTDVRFGDAKSTTKMLDHMVMVYNTSYLFYQMLTNIRLIVKYAREKKLKFVFFLFDYKSNLNGSYDQQMYFYEFPEFIPNFAIQDYMIDKGIDNLHPGVESNKILAKEIVLHLQRCYTYN